MKKLSVKKGSECMACLACVQACSMAFYKVMDPAKSCIQIVEKNGAPKPSVCAQCGKCAKTCEAGAIKQNAKGVYTIDKKSAPDAENAWKSVRSMSWSKQKNHRLRASVLPAVSVQKPVRWRSSKSWRNSISQRKRFLCTSIMATG